MNEEHNNTTGRTRVGLVVMTVTTPDTSRYWDDLDGEPLDAIEARKARQLEIECAGQMAVHEKVPIQSEVKGGENVRCVMRRCEE